MTGDDDDLPDDEPESEGELEPAVDAGSPAGIERQERKADRERREAEEFWRRILADPIGRREIWRVLGDLHTFEDRFACGPNGFPQPEATWFQAGEKAFGQRLYLTLARIDRAGVFLMHDEHDAKFAKPKRRARKRPD